MAATPKPFFDIIPEVIDNQTPTSKKAHNAYAASGGTLELASNIGKFGPSGIKSHHRH